MQLANLCFLRRGDEILLAMKKRGFGVGKWNGVGGKLNVMETARAATVREAKEEIGVIINPDDLEKVGEINFIFPEKSDAKLFVHVFFCTKWEGEPSESEEMRPQWFTISEIPFDEMWTDDKIWLPDAIAGKKFRAKFILKGEGEEIESYEVVWVESF